LSFLDALVKKKPDGSSGHFVYRKPTHMNLYLHAESEYHQALKRAVLSTLVHRVRNIFDMENLEAELLHLKKIFRKNPYSKLATHCAVCAPPPPQKKAMLP
jgi:hypothetical protein